MKAGDVLRQRRDYRLGLERLQLWLRSAEVACQPAPAELISKERGETLQRLLLELEPMEEIFKTISKAFQVSIILHLKNFFVNIHSSFS